MVKNTISDHLCIVDSLVDGSYQTVHVDRLLFYTEQRPDLLPDLRKHFEAQKGAYWEIDEILEVRTRNRVDEALVKWLGFDEPTWTKMSSLINDVPSVVEEFLRGGNVPESYRKRYKALLSK